MKKILCLALIFTIFSASLAYAASGDIAGNVLKTDIASFINNYPIRSYNINNSTALLVEDLKNYGFNVIWNGDKRTVDIFRNSKKEINPPRVYYKNAKECAGEFECYYYETDIVTYLNGEVIQAYNIGGKTAIPLSALKLCGDVLWDEATREAHVKIANLSSNTSSTVYTKYTSNVEAPMLENASSAKYIDSTENTLFMYNINDISVDDFSDYISILKDCGFYYMEEKSSQSESMYFTNDISVIQVYYQNNYLFISLSNA